MSGSHLAITASHHETGFGGFKAAGRCSSDLVPPYATWLVSLLTPKLFSCRCAFAEGMLGTVRSVDEGGKAILAATRRGFDDNFRSRATVDAPSQRYGRMHTGAFAETDG